MFYDELQDKKNKPDGKAAISGRLRESYQSFENSKDSFFLGEKDYPFASNRLDYFRNYASTYFNGDFIPGQGAEELLQFACNYQIQGRHLDLGSGPTGLFWFLPVQQATTITFSDVIPEALEILRQFKKDRKFPKCYREALDVVALQPNQLEKIFDSEVRYAVFDCFEEWPISVVKTRFERISAYGVLSICKDRIHYQKAVSEILDHLSEGGIFIGADWIRHDEFKIAEDGSDTSYLCEKMIAETFANENAELSELETIPLIGDALYGSLIAWVVKKRSE